MSPTRDLERRYTPGTVELRTENQEHGVQVRAFHGYALKFAKLSQNLGGFVEQVAGRSTIAKTLADGGDVVARMHHDDRYLLGRVSSGTLALDPDDVGLRYDVTSPDTTYARDLESLARRGDIRHSSFAFRTVADDWGLTDSGYPVRTLLEVQLVDVAPVVQPAYLDTSSSVRSLAGRLDASPDEVAELLRSGQIVRALKSAPAVVDLGERKFDPRQPRGHDGKWSDGPGGGIGGALDALTGHGGEEGSPLLPDFTPETTFKVRNGPKVELQGDGSNGGVKMRLHTDDDHAADVNMSGRDINRMERHLDAVDEALGERQAKAKQWQKDYESSPEQQAKEARRDELNAQMKAELQATGTGPGSPERVAIYNKYEKQIADEIGDQADNPFDDDSLLPESHAQVGDLHIAASLSDTGKSYYVASEPITDDNRSDVAAELSPKQMRNLLAKIRDVAEGTEAGRATTKTTETAAPDAIHVALTVRARQLELMRRSFL